MNDVEFFNSIVLPTVDDFSKKPGDIRLGVLACLALQAMNEHYYEHHKGNPSEVYNCKSRSDFKRKLRSRTWAFGQIMDGDYPLEAGIRPCRKFGPKCDP